MISCFVDMSCICSAQSISNFSLSCYLGLQCVHALQSSKHIRLKDINSPADHSTTMHFCCKLLGTCAHRNACLLQIFGYLHTAWTEIGFTHGDLNCANVMEHRGDADLYLPRGFTKSDENQVFKLPGKHLQHSFANSALCSTYMLAGMRPCS